MSPISWQSLVRISIKCEQEGIIRSEHRAVDKKGVFFSYFLTKTYVVGTQNRLNETVLLNTQNICIN